MKKLFILLSLLTNYSYTNTNFPSFNTAEFPSDFPSPPSPFPILLTNTPENLYNDFYQPITETIPQEYSETIVNSVILNNTKSEPQIITISVTNIQTNSITNILIDQPEVITEQSIINIPRVIDVTNYITNTVSNFITNIKSVTVPTSVDLSKQNPFDTQKFMIAAHRGDLSTLKKLLYKGISPDSRVVTDLKNGPTALITAAGERRFAVLDLLLKSGANPNFSASYNGLHGITPLMVASMNGPKENIELLITYGADVNAHTSGFVTGNSALTAAIGSAQEEAVDILIEKGADVNKTVNSKKNYGITPLMLAVEKGNISIISKLLEQPTININASDSEGKSALVYAYISGKFQIIKMLIDYGASTHLTDKQIEALVIKKREQKKP